MSKKERIKLEIDVLKALMLAFLTALFGIFGFCVLNYSRIDWIQDCFRGYFCLYFVVCF